MRKLLRVLVLVVASLAVVWLLACAWLTLRTPTVAAAEAGLRQPTNAWPAGFLWGTSTSAHQIEGGNRNDWTRFEAQGQIARGETSALAAGGWERMLDDVALSKQLRANAYRFSIEWSRVEPVEGRPNEEAWARYAALAKTLRAESITPMATLLHFTLPLWLADRGGVLAPDFKERFSRYAAEAARRLGPDVDLWVTLNEPIVQVYASYMNGDWPPQRKSSREGLAAMRALLRAHAAAAKALHRDDPGSQVLLANNLMWLEPRSRLMLGDWAAASVVDAFWNWSFPDAVRAGRLRVWLPDASLDEPMPELAGTVDAFGLNYYFRSRVRLAPLTADKVLLTPPGGGLVSELDTPPGDSPAGALLLLVREAHRRYSLPIYVTEGGIADNDGSKRGALLRGQAAALQRALADGVALRGYFHWSLYDNFEWQEGYRPRFGLYKVDRKTLARTPASGADVFAALAPGR